MSEKIQLPLPVYESHELGTLQSRDGEEFNMFIGLDKKTVEQLKQKSLDDSDTELQQNTSDRKRFGEGSYEEWYAKERTPYGLLNKDSLLAALVWFGPKPLGRKSLRFLSEEELKEESSQKETQWHTIVYRSYAPFRGKGIMRSFVQFALDDYKSRFPGAKFWAGISTKNEASMALASKLGFRVREDLTDESAQWGVMTIE
jgi:RimJ/RimL family protein N-acetyltransferase